MVKSKGKKVEEQESKSAKEKEKPKVTDKMIDDAPLAVTLSVDGQTLTGEKKDFKSGSAGWNINGKVVVGGLRCQVSGNIIIIGSKQLSKSK